MLTIRIIFYTTFHTIATEMKKKISISLDEKLLERIDEDRGLVPRSTFIEAILKRELK